jgi:hypothetical protein
MSATTTKNAPRKVAPALAAIVVRMGAQGPQQSAADLNTNSIYMGRLIAQGLATRVAKADVRTGERGRPAHRYTLTAAGRRVAKRLAKQEA